MVVCTSMLWRHGLLDLALLVAAADLDELNHFLKMTVFIVKNWLGEHSLELTESKTVVLRESRKWQDFRFSVGGHVMFPSRTWAFCSVKEVPYPHSLRKNKPTSTQRR